jgi:CubicO group peptidase (beta-lactamase class C family)
MLARLRPRHVRVFPVREVESRNAAAETDPRAAGLTRAAVEEMWNAVLRLYATGLHPAIALCVRRRGQVVIDRAVGHLSGNAPDDPPGAPLRRIRHDSRFSLFSASKAVTAMLVHLAAERGWLSLDDRVADHLPGFARHGKGDISLRDLLTHRAGLPSIHAPVDVELLADRARIVELLCDARPTLRPGRLAYHALSAGYLLGAVVERAAGADLRALLRREIAEPLGLRATSFGVPPAEVGEVAQNAFTGAPPLPPTSWMFRRSVGVGVEEATRISNHPAFLTSIVPSGNVVATAGEAARFFELLLRGGELDGRRIFAPGTVARAVRAHAERFEIDASLGLPIRYGMGFMLGGERLSLYGRRTPRAFGHVGFSNVVAWADPDRDLGVCLMTSGKPFITPGQLVWLNVARTISRVVPPQGPTTPWTSLRA